MHEQNSTSLVCVPAFDIRNVKAISGNMLIYSWINIFVHFCGMEHNGRVMPLGIRTESLSEYICGVLKFEKQVVFMKVGMFKNWITIEKYESKE